MDSAITTALRLNVAAMAGHGKIQANIAQNIAKATLSGYTQRLFAPEQATVSLALRSAQKSVAHAVFDVTSASNCIKPENVDLSAQIVKMISNQHAYEANARVVHTSDAMLGSLLDTKA